MASSRGNDETATDTQKPDSNNSSNNPMKSTWQTWPKKQWNVFHWLFHILDLAPQRLDRPVPVHQKDDKMAYTNDIELHLYIHAHATWPFFVHQAIVWYTGYRFTSGVAFGYYITCFKLSAVHIMHNLRELGHAHGFLDGDKHARDQIPDTQVANVAVSLVATGTIRPMMAVFFAWDSTKDPTSLSPWVVLEIGLYQLILDFFFYWYHRAMHDVDFLWKYHKKHHMTKHPNPLLSLYADTEQEIFDIFVIPILAYATMRYGLRLPMGFYDWWICQIYVVVTELWGHSGLRVWTNPASTLSPLLNFFGVALTIEDHDLHHRQGWKKSHNYGKQTKVWDTVFGTGSKRIEAVPENVDWDTRARLLW